MVKAFEVGKSYWTRSIGDSECIFSFEIVSRTAKQVTFHSRGDTQKRGIYVYDNSERFMPFGKFSMAPIISADKEGTGPMMLECQRVRRVKASINARLIWEDVSTLNANLVWIIRCEEMSNLTGFASI